MPFAQADGARIFWRCDGRDAGAPVANTAFAQGRAGSLRQTAHDWPRWTSSRDGDTVVHQGKGSLKFLYPMAPALHARAEEAAQFRLTRARRRLIEETPQ